MIKLIECNYCQGAIDEPDVFWFMGLPFHRECFEEKTAEWKGVVVWMPERTTKRTTRSTQPPNIINRL